MGERDLDLARLDKEIELCVEHVNATDSRRTVMGDFIAKCLLVRIYGQYEIAIRGAVRLKLENITDEACCRRVNAKLNKFSLFLNELEKILRQFGNGHVKKFNDEIDGDTRTGYDNLIGNRHSIAHGRDMNSPLTTYPKPTYTERRYCRSLKAGWG